MTATACGRGLAALAAGCFLGPDLGLAQGGAGADGRSLVSLGSSAGTREVPLELRPRDPSSPVVAFEVGFRTTESPDAGELHDAFSVTLFRSGVPGATVLVVTDVFGMLSLPAVPGGLAIPPGALTITSVAPRLDPLPGETVGVAYELTLALPPVYRDRELGLMVSFFDNGDALPSVGYVRATVVPEASATALSLGGVAMMAMTAWATRERGRRPGLGRTRDVEGRTR